MTLSLEQIKQFRQWGSMTPGHPERGVTPGVEVTTGPLGQGFGNGVGMAMAEAHLAARYNRPGFEIVNHFTYAIVSDGDLMEGVASEAASLAGHLQLGKLIYLYDDNHVTLSAGTDITFTEDRARRFEAYGWHTQSVEDGNDLAAIDRALRAARDEAARPSLILVRTHIGYGSPHKQDTFEAHGSPLGADEVRLTKEALGWPTEPAFYVPEPARAHFRQAARARRARRERVERPVRRVCASLSRSSRANCSRRCAANCRPAGTRTFRFSRPTRRAWPPASPAGKVMNAVAAAAAGVDRRLGGSGSVDATPRSRAGRFRAAAAHGCDTQGADGGGWSYAGRNLHFGVREHGMGAIMNGLAAHGGTVPFGATFLIFSDYMRPPIRLAALMGLHVIYVFTHDSIALGEDGSDASAGRATRRPARDPEPHRDPPGDANETAVAWRVAMETRGSARSRWC